MKLKQKVIRSELSGAYLLGRMTIVLEVFLSLEADLISTLFRVVGGCTSGLYTTTHRMLAVGDHLRDLMYQNCRNHGRNCNAKYILGDTEFLSATICICINIYRERERERQREPLKANLLGRT